MRRLFHERSTQKLTVQALETLAVIAYKQPITALEIGEIRGVNTSGVLSTLLERHLIKIVGRKNVVGRPFMYATTKEFLDPLRPEGPADLPKIEDMAEALGFDPPGRAHRADAERGRAAAGRDGRGGARRRRRGSRACSFVTSAALESRHSPGREPAIADRADAGARQRLHRMADGFAHAAHLSVASLADRDQQHARVLGARAPWPRVSSVASAGSVRWPSSGIPSRSRRAPPRPACRRRGPRRCARRRGAGG